MYSDEITVRKETIPNDTGKSARLFAYSSTLFGSAELKKEPDKTGLGTCNNA